MMKIERVEPIISVEQTLELVRLGCGSRTVQMEKAVAMALECIHRPTYIVNDSNDQEGR
jgi:hypothetical protein